jgi:flagellin
MIINNNLAAKNAYRNYFNVTGQLGRSTEKLSSGLRINRAADDASGLVISQVLRAQISGLEMATRNAQDGVSLAQTAEGAMQEVNDILERMRDLAVQASNGSASVSARCASDAEFQQLKSEIQRIGSFTTFGGLNLFSATAAASFHAGVTFQVGPNAAGSIAMTIQTLNFGSVSSVAFFTTSRIDSATFALSQITNLDNAINQVATSRGNIGAFQNRLESTVRSNMVAAENVQAAESRLRDVDVAKEMTNFTRLSIMQQTASAMLGQANNLPNGVLRLIG